MPIAARSYAREYQDRLTSTYAGVLRETDSRAADRLECLLDLEKIEIDTVAASLVAEDLRRAAKAQRMQSYIAFWDKLSVAEQRRLAEDYAKVLTLSRNIATVAVTDIVQAHNAVRATTAGSIDFVMRRFREADVAPSQVQSFLDENAVAWFSLTAHPTNPATLEYSLAEIDLTALLADPAATGDKLTDALRRIRDVAIVGDRKSPLDEARETLGTLQVIFDCALGHKALFDNAIERHGYAAEGVRIRTPLIRPGIWALGDGDGNPAMTAEVLRDGIRLYRGAIKRRYMHFIEGLRIEAAADYQALKRLDAIAGALAVIDEPDARLPDLEGLIEQVGDLAAHAPLLAQGLGELAYLLSCFKFGFATIDIRHNAADVIDTVASLLDHAGVETRRDFFALSDPDREALLARCLDDDPLMQRCLALTPDDLRAGGDMTAFNILGRLQTIGRNPDICEKLILAETTSAGEAMAGLFLMKATGNAIGSHRSRIDLVTLSESSADLLSLSRTLETLLDNPTYRAHVVARGVLLAMVAKSDTTRQDGRGRAEYAQHEGAVAVYAVIDRMKGRYPELENVLPSVMNGGGLALQRGGGRVTEVAALHGRAAYDARACDMGPSTLTIQGHQQRILFAPYKTAIGTLEALAAMNLYSKAGIQGEMPPPENFPDINRQYARQDAWMYAKVAGDVFERLTRHNDSIDALLIGAPWIAIKAGNVSSRPGKRGEKLFGPGVTPREAKTGNGHDQPKALQGRAISGERLVGHACVPVFTLLGLAEAMQAVASESPVNLNREKYGEPLHHLYKSHKIQRDGARVNINAAPIADFDIAWPLLAGRERPDKVEIDALARQFRDGENSGAAPPDVTLAFLEKYFLEVEKLTFEMVTGQAADSGFRHGDGLKRLWPELAEQVEYRNRTAEFARVIEMELTRRMDAAPDVPVDADHFRIIQAIYTAADVIDAPTGILATRTRIEPGETMPQSFNETDVRDRLSLPAGLV